MDNVDSAYRLRLGPTGRVEWVEPSGGGEQIVHRDEPDASWLGAFKNWLLLHFVGEELL